MAWYRTGTVTVTNNSNVVTGVGTAWVDAVAMGETFLGPDAQVYEITSIASATSLRISPNYKGSTAAAQSYAIMPTQSYLRDLAAQAAALVNSYAAVRDNAGAGKFAAGTAAAPSLRAIADEDTGVNLPGGNVLQLVTNGAMQLQVAADGTPTGNVAIKMPVSALQQAALDGCVKTSGSQTVGGVKTFTSNPVLDGAAGGGRSIWAKTAGVERWRFGAGGEAELGGDNGTWFFVTACKDDGSLLRDSSIRIARTDGCVRLPLNYNNTTASASNVFIAPAGVLQRSTSSLKYKTAVEDVDAALMQRVIDEAHPIWYRSTCAADNSGHSWWGLGAEDLGAIDPRFVHWAHPNKTVERVEFEEAEEPTGELGLDGEPLMHRVTKELRRAEQVPDTDAPLQAEGVMYERLVVPLLWHAKQMQSRLDVMEQRLAALEGAA